MPAVAGSDQEPFLYYLGTADGGVFKTTNGGASWHAVFADKPVAALGAVAVSASNPSDVWIGTGEGNPRSNVSYGDGVWRSLDGAKNWKHLGLDRTSQITKILLDPKHPDTALIAALGNPFADSRDRGVYRTVDGGRTWARTLYAGPSTGASDLAWDPKNPNTVFAGMFEFRRYPWNIVSGGPNSGLYRSRDGGAHWERLTGHGLPSGLMGRIGVALAPSDSKRVYAIIQSKQGYVWRSDDGGDNWQRTAATSLVNERPWYFSHLWVDPRDENHVYATSVQLAESHNGGQTFTGIENAENVDYHSLWFSADGRRIIAGHDGGWALSQDGGKTWDWRLNLAISQTHHLGYDLQNPYRVCAGFQDAETFCGPSNSLNPEGILNRDWISLNGGDGTWVWPDPLDPHLIWNDVQIGELGIFDTTTQQLVQNWPYPYDTNAIGVAGLPYRFSWEAPIAFSSQDGHVMYFGGNVLFSTDDRGQHWQVISPDLTLNERAHQQTPGGPITIEGAGVEFYDTIVDIGPSPLEAGVIWAGTDDGIIQLTRDGGLSWHNVSVKRIEKYGRVNTVEPSHTSRGVAYAVIDRHMLGDRRPYVFKTDDYGATWRSISANLPNNQFLHVVREDPHNPSVLYAGSEQGIFVSLDGGRTWSSLQQNLPTASVRDIRIHPVANDLIVGTHGRSLWILDDLTPLQEFAKAKAAGIYLYQPRTAYAWSLWEPEQPGYGTQPPLGAFTGQNPAYGAIITYYLGVSGKKAPTAEIVDESGRAVRHLGGSEGLANKSGLNRLAWNLTEDPPRPWKGTPSWNQGVSDGPEAVPGRYTVRLHVGQTTLVRDFVVQADPRASFTQAQYAERHKFLAEFLAMLSNVDTALNSLDDLRNRLRERRGQVAGRPGSMRLLALIDAASGKAGTIFSTLTSNPVASQDADFLPDRLRERIQFIIAMLNLPLGGGTGTYGSAYLGPPLETHYKAGAEVRTLYVRRMSAYEKFMKEDIATLNAALQKAGYKPLTYRT